MTTVRKVDNSHLSEKAQKVREILSIAIRENGVRGSITPVIRQIIFVHSPNTNEFWTNTVAELMKEWMPELVNEINEVLE